MIRQPIITVLGHVDHGKTSLLDAVRGSGVASREAGGITQAIGASILPKETLQLLCGDFLKKMKQDIIIPGLLFIDTPGHSAFTTLRKRGGSIADLAILVVDLNEGLKPQTRESLAILKASKTPFVVAGTKLDLVKGWFSKGKPLLQTFADQHAPTMVDLDKKVYSIVAGLSEEGFPSDRFDRVDSFAKTVAIVPVSSKSRDGIPELLAVLTGLAQKYLEQSLMADVTGPGRATILEVKEQKGLGVVLDVILSDGSLSVKDEVIVGSLDGPKKTKVKALFLPASGVDIREAGTKFSSVKSVSAATGVRVNLLDSDGVVAGMPLFVVRKNEKEVIALVKEQLSLSSIPTSEQGVVVKADTIGSLEALSSLLLENDIPVSVASIGPVSKSDVAEAEAQRSNEEKFGCVIAFNLPLLSSSVSSGGVKIIQKNIIYSIIDEYKSWIDELSMSRKKAESQGVPLPAKIQLLKGFTFRQSSPAVIGCEVLEGSLKTNVWLMSSSCEKLTQVKGIEVDKVKKDVLERGEKAAISLPDVVIGRTVREGAILYTVIDEEVFKHYKEHKDDLTITQKTALKEIAVVMREHNPVWGV